MGNCLNSFVLPFHSRIYKWFISFLLFVLESQNRLPLGNPVKKLKLIAVGMMRLSVRRRLLLTIAQELLQIVRLPFLTTALMEWLPKGSNSVHMKPSISLSFVVLCMRALMSSRCHLMKKMNRLLTLKRTLILSLKVAMHRRYMECFAVFVFF